MLQSKAKIALPFLCCCFWTIIFNVFLSFFFHLSAHTHTKIGKEGVCADFPLQNQYQLVKEAYIWRGIENITDAVFQQPCPTSQVGYNIYYSNFYIGGVDETPAKQRSGGDTFILNCRGETIYTFSNLTVHDSSGGLVGTLDFEDVPLVLTNPEGERVAQWCRDSKTITLVVHSEIDRVLLFAIAGKYAFRGYNECTTKYWMTLQIVIISGILSIISMVAMGIVMCRPKSHRYALRASAEGGARKNLSLKTFNTK